MLCKVRREDEEVRMKAHQLWEAAGCPPGRNAEFWNQAFQEVTGRNETASGLPHAVPRSDQHPAH